MISISQTEQGARLVDLSLVAQRPPAWYTPETKEMCGMTKVGASTVGWRPISFKCSRGLNTQR